MSFELRVSATLLSTDGSLNDSSTPRKGDKNPWIRFSIEYRHRDNGDLIHRKVTERFSNKCRDFDNISMPVFEVLTIYTTKPIESGDSRKIPSLLFTAMTAPSYKLRIFSPAIINALQSVAQYYPAQELAGEVIVVQWPYAVLVHHYDELSDFGDACAAKDPSRMCIRERKAHEQLTLLLQFLDEHVMADVRAEIAQQEGLLYGVFDNSPRGPIPPGSLYTTGNTLEEIFTNVTLQKLAVKSTLLKSSVSWK